MPSGVHGSTGSNPELSATFVAGVFHQRVPRLRLGTRDFPKHLSSRMRMELHGLSTRGRGFESHQLHLNGIAIMAMPRYAFQPGP